MVFSSYEFILSFLPVVLAGFLVLGGFGKRLGILVWLILASFWFLGSWRTSDLLILIGSILSNYAIGRAIVRYREQPLGKVLVGIGVAGNLALIGYFKYSVFIMSSVAEATGMAVPIPEVALPLAISFYTFQQIAFLVDARKGLFVKTGFVDYCFFVGFFPQLIAGPLVNFRSVRDQIASAGTFRPDPEKIAFGLAIFVVGLAKKVLIADTIAPTADAIFGAAAAGDVLTIFEAWGGAVAYTLQLYFDFSGYSDMAIGLAMMFGIRLPLNFNSPYKATSIVDFWRRWHMTLSAFLRNYLYIGLGGNRKGPVRRYVNLFITMLLGGLWHGAGWTFVVWGALHGVYLVICHAWRHLTGSDGSAPTGWALTWFYRCLTLLAVVVGWVYFRAGDLDVAHSILSSMFGANGVDLPPRLASLGASLDWLGVGVRTSPFLPSVEIMAWMAVLTGVVLYMPNTQEIFRYLPERLARQRVRGFATHPAVPLVLGAVFVVALSRMSAIQVFLYFNF